MAYLGENGDTSGVTGHGWSGADLGFSDVTSNQDGENYQAHEFTFQHEPGKPKTHFIVCCLLKKQIRNLIKPK